VARQKAAITQGIQIKRETRHWDSERKVTVPTRLKESEEDYRYFPDPDLPPYPIATGYINKISKEMPELPDARIKRFMEQYGISFKEANVLVMDKALADLFENTAKLYKNYQKLANLLVNDYLRWINDKKIRVTDSKASPNNIADLLNMLDSGIVTIKIVKSVLPDLILDGKSPKEIINRSQLTAVKDQEYLEKVISEVIEEEKDAAIAAKNDPKVVNYLVGKVMKKTGNRADPQLTNSLIRKRLGL